MELKQTPRRHTQATVPLFTTAPCVVAAAWPIHLHDRITPATATYNAASAHHCIKPAL
ncbi:hypothetical protein [Xylella fastidiosa]|uniref:hypothetical protein n=1 Tax=Xylella fastidiosa TaxID=2371 RepID=UPI0021CCA4BF|nr:hypothetical protein [Xylella fastidiosa]